MNHVRIITMPKTKYRIKRLSCFSCLHCSVFLYSHVNYLQLRKALAIKCSQFVPSMRENILRFSFALHSLHL